MFVQCVRLSRLSVGFRMHSKSLQFHSFVHLVTPRHLIDVGMRATSSVTSLCRHIDIAVQRHERRRMTSRRRDSTSYGHRSPTSCRRPVLTSIRHRILKSKRRLIATSATSLAIENFQCVYQCDPSSVVIRRDPTSYRWSKCDVYRTSDHDVVWQRLLEIGSR